MSSKADYDVIIIGAGIVGLTLALALSKSNLRIALLDIQMPELELSGSNKSHKIAAIHAAYHRTTKSASETHADNLHTAEKASETHADNLHIAENTSEIHADNSHATKNTSVFHTYDLRVSAISPAAVKVFHALGAWSHMVDLRVSPYRDMTVWDASSHGHIQFNSADVGAANLGYIIENSVIQTALFKQLICADSVSCFSDAILSDIQLLADSAVVTLTDGRQLTAKLIVGADGANSLVRELAGIKTVEWDYGHTALVATIHTALPHQETAYQRFLATGPLAFLPLSDPHQCSIVWSTTPQEAERLKQIDILDFERELATAFEQRLGATTLVSDRAIFPLRMRHAKQYVKDRIVLAGDAAHTIHPLAGQGVNLGIFDAACLSEIIIATAAKQRDIGTIHNLRRYERWRKGDNMTMLASMEIFKRLFGLQQLPVRWLRETGLNLTNQLTPLKTLIIQYAMGLRGDLPLLAQGLLPN